MRKLLYFKTSVNEKKMRNLLVTRILNVMTSDKSERQQHNINNRYSVK